MHLGSQSPMNDVKAHTADVASLIMLKEQHEPQLSLSEEVGGVRLGGEVTEARDGVMCFPLFYNLEETVISSPGITNLKGKKLKGYGSANNKPQE